jgi:hypothetical protein
VGGNRTWVSEAAITSSTGGVGQTISGMAGMPRRWPQAGGAAASSSHGAGYVCRRCGKAGHFLPNCPTNSDPSYDKQPPQKLMNTSTGSRKIVATLEGIDTKNKTVIYCTLLIINLTKKIVMYHEIFILFMLLLIYSLYANEFLFFSVKYSQLVRILSIPSQEKKIKNIVHHNNLKIFLSRFLMLCMHTN